MSTLRCCWNNDQNALESVNGYPDPSVVLDETDVVEEVCSVTDPGPSTKVLAVDGVDGFDDMSSIRSTYRGVWLVHVSATSA